MLSIGWGAKRLIYNAAIVPNSPGTTGAATRSIDCYDEIIPCK
jgi:hypothetical protein